MTREDLTRRGIGWRLAVLGLVIAMTGCESDSVNSPVTIDPGNITIRRGQQQVFVAEGGYDYQWSIEDKTLGTLTRTRDANRVTYTAIATPEEGTAVTQVLRVTSWIEGAPHTTGTTTTNAATHRVSAEAYIVHLAP